MPRSEFWEGFSKGLDFYFANPENRGTIPSQNYHPVVDGTTIHYFGRNVQRYILGGLPEERCPEYVREKVKKYNLLTEENKAIVVARNMRKNAKRPQAFEQEPWSVQPLSNIRDSGSSQSELQHSFPVNPAAPPVSTSADLFPSGDLPGGNKTVKRPRRKREKTKLPRQDYWRRFNEGLDEYLATPPHRRTLPTQTPALAADDTPLKYFARIYERYIFAGKLPSDCPNYIKDKLRGHNLLNKENVPINPPPLDALPNPSTFSYGGLPNASSYSQDFIQDPTNIGDPHASGTLAPPSAQHETQRFLKRNEYWALFDKAYDDYYSDKKNLGTFPPFSYAPKIDGTTFLFGRNMRNYIREGGFKDCPDNLKAKIESSGLLEDDVRAALAKRNQKKGPGDWAAFEEAVRRHYKNRLNLGRLPLRSACTEVDGVTVRYGDNWADWRKNGYPRNIPESLKNQLEGYQRESELSELMGPGRAAEQPPSGISEDREVISTADNPATGGGSQSNTVGADLPHSELTSSFTFNQAAPFASMPGGTQPTDTFPHGFLLDADSHGAAPQPYVPGFDVWPDNYAPQTALGTDETFQTPYANSFSQFACPMDPDQDNMMSSGLPPSGYMPWLPTDSVAPLVAQPAQTFSAPNGLLDAHSYPAAGYPAALTFLPEAQTQANTPGVYPSQTGHMYPQPFSPVDRGQSHSGSGSGMGR
ncbi:hypothetical protein [Streptomyces sp. NPDC006012]|uniref:hypothetical protein n=1 Tax=Streptomyces sp. NPDC006012 TaxID=3364739 RepID=UPI00369F2CBC